MKRRGRVELSVSELSAFAGFRFPPEVILSVVRWYLRFGLSYRVLEELLAERGIRVDHVTSLAQPGPLDPSSGPALRRRTITRVVTQDRSAPT
jgi:transposase-like protein